VALAAAALPIAYALRATVLIAIGTAGSLGGMAGVGPARVIHAAVGFVAIVHWLAAISLPAALLFRSRYRAYAGTRYFLITGLGLTLPFVGYSVALFGRGALGVQIAGAVAILAIGFGLLGFMGADAHISGHYIAGAVITAITAQLGLHVLDGMTAMGALAMASRMGSLVAFAGCCVLTALGAFQLLARRHWSEARSIDLRRGDGDDGQDREDGEDRSLGDSWTSRK
jgi:hypothetical protein